MNGKETRHIEIRRLMDEGRSAEEIATLTGLRPTSVDSYRYAVRRPGEVIKPNGRAPRADGVEFVGFVARLTFTQAQAQRIKDSALRYGYGRPRHLIEALIATIADDDLFNAVLDGRNDNP
jgi:hypothetical protein